MAIEKQQILELMNGQDEVDAKAENLLKLIGEDFASQMNAVLMNKEQIIVEKREEVAKRRALETELENFKKKELELQEQLKKSSPDEVRKVYEAQLTDAASVYEKEASKLNATIEAQKERITMLESYQRKLECMKVFNKAVSDKNIAADSLQDFADYVLGIDCSKFDHRPIGDGKTVLATKDGITIEAAVKAALETSFGKRCVVTNTTGGGAGGGSPVSEVSTNPFAKDTFNLTLQAELYNKDPALAEKLRKAAK